MTGSLAIDKQQFKLTFVVENRYKFKIALKFLMITVPKTFLIHTKQYIHELWTNTGGTVHMLYRYYFA